MTAYLRMHTSYSGVEKSWAMTPHSAVARSEGHIAYFSLGFFCSRILYINAKCSFSSNGFFVPYQLCLYRVFEGLLPLQIIQFDYFLKMSSTVTLLEPVLRLEASPSLSQLSKKTETLRLVRIPDLFSSFMSVDPDINPHYRNSKAEADEWFKRYSLCCTKMKLIVVLADRRQIVAVERQR